MTPKEKAEELTDRMWLSSNAQDDAWMDSELAKKCALIAVDEIIKVLYNANEEFGYWTEVKQEIINL
jgi:hypothetical protein